MILVGAAPIFSHDGMFFSRQRLIANALSRSRWRQIVVFPGLVGRRDDLCLLRHPDDDGVNAVIFVKAKQL
jgi:hypothetical protein